jgi:hypothetical protein
MGIFGVNMPLLYGEGEKAFVRLQEEVLESAEDYSLLTWHTEILREKDVRVRDVDIHVEPDEEFDTSVKGWKSLLGPGQTYDCFGLIAPAPSLFRINRFCRCELKSNLSGETTPTITGRGLSMKVQLRPLAPTTNIIGRRTWEDNIVHNFGTHAHHLYFVAIPELLAHPHRAEAERNKSALVILCYNISDDENSRHQEMVRISPYIIEWPTLEVNQDYAWSTSICHFRKLGRMKLEPSKPDFSRWNTSHSLVWAQSLQAKNHQDALLQWGKASPKWSIAEVGLRNDVANGASCVVALLVQEGVDESGQQFDSLDFLPIICCLKGNKIAIGSFAGDRQWLTDWQGQLTATSGWLYGQKQRDLVNSVTEALSSDGPIAEREFEIGYDKLVVTAIATKLDTMSFERAGSSTSEVRLWLSFRS